MCNMNLYELNFKKKSVFSLWQISQKAYLSNLYVVESIGTVGNKWIGSNLQLSDKMMIIAESKRSMITFCDRNANPNQRGATIYYIIYKKNNSLRIRINCFWTLPSGRQCGIFNINKTFVYAVILMQCEC